MDDERFANMLFGDTPPISDIYLRKCLAAFDAIRYLENKLASESAQVARLEHALKTARRKALDEAVKEIECDCPGRDKIAPLPPNSGERWRLCSEHNCRAILAAAIRALIEKGGK